MRIRSLVAAGALVVTAAVAPVTVAQASFSQCPSNRLCLWGNNDFRWLIHTRSPNGGRVALSGDANDEMDSWGNRTTVGARGYANSNGTGDCQSWNAGSRDNNVAPWNSDEISSTYTNGTC